MTTDRQRQGSASRDRAGMPRAFVVDLEPLGRRIDAKAGESLLAAAQAAGVELAAICGGVGACDTCRVRRVAGTLSAPTLVEEALFSPEALRDGWRLACQAEVLGDVKLEIPPDSLTATQRLQVDGVVGTLALDPLITAVDVRLSPPTLDDLRPDATRLSDALSAAGCAALSFSPPMLAAVSGHLRAHDWSARLALREGRHLAGVLDVTEPLLGLAVDIGTTSIAAYLVDLTSGAALATAGAMNPQIAFGEDVVSRILYLNQHPDQPQLLQTRVVDTLNDLIGQLCECAGVLPRRIVDAVLVGNTAMHHIVAGLPVTSLGEAPYVPVVADALEFPAAAIGLTLSPGALVYMPPNIAGYVGADHVAVLLATDLWDSQRTRLAVDIGTNTEVTLAYGGQCYSCSCASGPAFEGAHIHDGMRAAPGAIERVRIIDGAVHVQTIGGVAPVGICGSGILDAVAVMVEHGMVGANGAFRPGNPLISRDEAGPMLVLAAAAESGRGRAVAVHRRDVAEIQLAKSAIRTGIDLLLERAGISADAIEEVIVAGAFGTYIDLAGALRIGLFPPLPLERFRQVGNAAGMGAWQLLVSGASRRTVEQRARAITYVELTTHPQFQDTFADRLLL